MANPSFIIPIKVGDFSIETTIPISNHVAIYRCKIDGINKRLFRHNETGYYTSLDVLRALRLGYGVTLQQDGEPNTLKWAMTKCCRGAMAFSKFVKLLFNLKKEHKIGLAKAILNRLWGKLCKLKKNQYIRSDHDPVIELKPDCPIIGIRPNFRDENQTLVEREGEFYSPWARMKPFLLARGRVMISEVAEPIINDVVWMHTDGIVAKIKPNTTGNNLGELRWEGFCTACTVHRKHLRVEGEFKLE